MEEFWRWNDEWIVLASDVDAQFERWPISDPSDFTELPVLERDHEMESA